MVLPDSDGVSRVPPYSGSTLERMQFRLQGCYLLWRAFPDRFVYTFLSHSVLSVLQPQEASLLVWALSVSLAATQEIDFLSFPPGTEMFQFPGSASQTLWIQVRVLFHDEQWVPPFGNLRIKAYLQLPEAYRCSSRPSSAPSAKAFAVCPSLNLTS